MKFLVLMSVALLGLFSGCKKTAAEDDTTVCPPPQSLAGTWELRQVQSSMLPLETLAAGNGNKLVLTSTTYAFSQGGQVTKSGQFTLVNDTTVSSSVCLNLTGYYRIVYDSNYTATKTFFTFSADNKLKLVSGCFALDAGALQTYERIIR